MAYPYGNKPYGLNDAKLTNIGGTTQVDLPAAQKVSVKLNISKAELEGDDSIVAVISRVKSAEWELEAGGIDLTAWALMTGSSVVTSGTTPTEKSTFELAGGANLPYFKIYGKSLGDGIDDLHLKLCKCKLTELEGEFGQNAFFITKCKGIAIDDGTNGVIQVVAEETAAALPTT